VNSEQNNTLGSAVKEKAKQERNPTATQWIFVQRENPKLNQDTLMIFPFETILWREARENRATQTEPFPSLEGCSRTEKRFSEKIRK
jgi:hypothetical protein